MAYTVTGQPAELVKLLTEQRNQYRRLRGLTQRQRTLVLDEDSPALLSLLNERQRVVEDLTALGARLSPYRREWTRVYDGLDPAMRGQVKELLEESNALLASVMTADRQDTEMLGARRQSAAAGLSATRLTGRASAAYASSTAAGPAAQLAEAHA